VSIIEQAARRLDELRKAGIEVAPPVAPTDVAVQRQAVKVAPRARSSGDELAGSETRASRSVDLDLLRLASRGLITPDAPRSTLAEQFRAIKRPLLMNVRGQSAAPVERANCIMVTSSTAGEGKTFTAINLALSLASEVDNTVLLVDADVIRPAVLERLGLPLDRGLMDILLDPTLSAADVILRTNIPKLSILPAGTPNNHATELLASQVMQRLVEDLAFRYPDRIVVFDAPPLLMSNEARVLASIMGQIVVVVEAGRTTQSTVREALAAVEGCPVVMTLLNKTRPGAGGSVYGYYGQ
jgi:receptor protein-tyrosine kinase